MAHLLGYARVSTSEQNPDLQLDALKGPDCFQVLVRCRTHHRGATGDAARWSRPTSVRM